MIKKYSFFLIIIVLLACNNNDTAQMDAAAEPEAATETANSLERFEAEIVKFGEARESVHQEEVIVFTGSSSIRMWETLSEDMSPMPVVNHGFGGSTLPEVNYYFDKLITNLQPRKVVLYCGENDIAEGASSEDVYESFVTFMNIMEEKLPKATVYFLPLKPSIARWELWEQYKEANDLIKAYSEENNRVQFVDITISMLDENGEVKQDIFIEDGLHMNAKGYKGWTAIVKEAIQ